MPKFYKDINEKQLQDYAIKAGFGSGYPIDLKKLKKFFKKGDKILEVGCGTGRLGKYLIKDYKYIGIDEHEPYLKVFKNFLIKQGVKNSGDYVVNSSFMKFKGNRFNVVVFPWTVLWDFPAKGQILALKKAWKMLAPGGVVLLDNPTKGAVHNSIKTYSPITFYYDDWKDKFPKLGFSKHKRVKYKTLTGRVREIIILRK